MNLKKNKKDVTRLVLRFLGEKYLFAWKLGNAPGYQIGAEDCRTKVWEYLRRYLWILLVPAAYIVGVAGTSHLESMEKSAAVSPYLLIFLLWVILGMIAIPSILLPVFAFCSIFMEHGDFPGTTAFKLAKAWRAVRKTAIKTGLVETIVDEVMRNDQLYKPGSTILNFVWGSLDDFTTSYIKQKLMDECVKVLVAERDGFPGRKKKARALFGSLHKLAGSLHIQVDSWEKYFAAARIAK